MGKTKRAASATPNYLVSNAKVTNNSEKSKGILDNLSVTEQVALRLLSFHADRRKAGAQVVAKPIDERLQFVADSLLRCSQLLAVAFEELDSFTTGMEVEND